MAALPDRVTEAGEKIAGTYRNIVEPLGTALPEGERMWGELQQGWTHDEDLVMSLDGCLTRHDERDTNVGRTA